MRTNFLFGVNVLLMVQLCSGIRIEFLPPYSPDYNPIELAFSAMKYRLRRNGDYVRMAMTEMNMDEIYVCLMKALFATSRQDCFGWFRHCGYV